MKRGFPFQKYRLQNKNRGPATVAITSCFNDNQMTGLAATTGISQSTLCKQPASSFGHHFSIYTNQNIIRTIRLSMGQFKVAQDPVDR
jgi:hypothetical protein